MEPEKSSIEETDAYNAMCALVHGPNHHRLRMRKVALRSRYPEIGRALPGGILHLRLDEFGNPELLERKKVVVLRFVPNGIRFNHPNYKLDRKTIDMALTMVRKYTNMAPNALRRGLIRTDIEQLKNDSNIDHHDIGYTQSILRSCPNKGSDCRVCNLVKKAIPMIESEVSAYKEFEEQYTIFGEKTEDGLFYPFVPYFPEETKNVDMSYLPGPLLEEWEKVKNARDWVRRGRGKTQQPI